MHKTNKDNLIKAGVLLGLTVGMATMAVAGQGGAEFDSVYDTLVDWSQGTLGRIIAIAMILVGLVAGVVRQSIMSVVIGVAGGMSLYNAPTVIEAIMTANTVADAAQVALLVNGLS